MIIIFLNELFIFTFFIFRKIFLKVRRKKEDTHEFTIQRYGQKN